MASIDHILQTARDLGSLIAEHQATKKFQQAVKALQDDTDAQRVMTDFNRHLNTIAEKEQQGKPIEVADKHKLEDLQKKVIMNSKLQKLQMAQMDYMDLMRQVDEAITGQGPEEITDDIAAAESPLINPDLSS